VQSPKPPPAPDPVATSKTQTASNVATATADKHLNSTDQSTPYGDLKYEVIGYEDVSDGLGGTNKVPRYRAVQTLSEPQQRLLDVNNDTELRMATIANNQTGRVGDLLSKPIDLSNEATEGRLFDLGRKRLDPMLNQRLDELRTRLTNQGIRAGTDAYDAEMRREGESRNDAYNSLLLQGRAQAVQEALTERNQPINETTALLSGAQIQAPNFINTPQTAVAGTDYSGNVYRSYQGQLEAFKQQQAGNNAMMGGLFGLTAAPFSMFRMGR
jgi:outer membrane protein OmpA-like peptidoglycan-associated protein